MCIDEHSKYKDYFYDSQQRAVVETKQYGFKIVKEISNSGHYLMEYDNK